MVVYLFIVEAVIAFSDPMPAIENYPLTEHLILDLRSARSSGIILMKLSTALSWF